MLDDPDRRLRALHHVGGNANVAKRAERLHQLYEDAVAANRAKSEFIFSLSHELRMPLHVILGYCDMLLDEEHGGAAQERRHMSVRIHDAAHELLHLVDSILEFGKLEAGRMPVAAAPVALDRFVEHLQRRPRFALAPAATLRWDVPRDLPVIHTDAAKLSTILDNLINNAIKFTAQGSITVRVNDRAQNGSVEFRITDTGPGIAVEQLPLIFEPFHQAGPSSHAAGGVGLGLAIVRRYVDLLGGAICVESTIGRGTTFAVTLPYQVAISPAAGAPLRRSEQRPS